MEISQEQLIKAPPERVFAALNDAAVLQKCIPGCESLEKTPDGRMRAAVKVKIGPVNARFSGAVQLSDITPPHGCTISGEGTAGAAGFAKGEAVVRLAADADGTILRWTAKVQTGGKIAQLGGRLIESVAKKLAGQFFDSLTAHLEEPAESEKSEKSAPKKSAAATDSAITAHFRRPFLWIILISAAGLAVAAAVFL